MSSPPYLLFLVVPALALIDAGLVAPKHMTDVLAQKLGAAFISGACCMIGGYALWMYQFNVALGVPHPLQQAYSDWWLFGRYMGMYSQNIDPAAAPGADVSQISSSFSSPTPPSSGLSFTASDWGENEAERVLHPVGHSGRHPDAHHGVSHLELCESPDQQRNARFRRRLFALHVHRRVGPHHCVAPGAPYRLDERLQSPSAGIGRDAAHGDRSRVRPGLRIHGAGHRLLRRHQYHHRIGNRLLQCVLCVQRGRDLRPDPGLLEAQAGVHVPGVHLGVCVLFGAVRHRGRRGSVSSSPCAVPG